jgi:hypothetical protein
MPGRRERDHTVGQGHHGLDGGEVVPVDEEDAVLGGGGQLGGGVGDQTPEAVSEGGADLAGSERGSRPDAGDHGAGGVGVAAGRGPGLQGRLERADPGRLAAAHGDQGVGLGQGGAHGWPVGGGQVDDDHAEGGPGDLQHPLDGPGPGWRVGGAVGQAGQRQHGQTGPRLGQRTGKRARVQDTGVHQERSAGRVDGRWRAGGRGEG